MKKIIAMLLVMVLALSLLTACGAAKSDSDLAAITSFENLPLVLHVKELAEVLSISQNTAYALVRSGQIRSIRTGRIYRIPKDALIEYLNQG